MPDTTAPPSPYLLTLDDSAHTDTKYFSRQMILKGVGEGQNNDLQNFRKLDSLSVLHSRTIARAGRALGLIL